MKNAWTRVLLLKTITEILGKIEQPLLRKFEDIELPNPRIALTPMTACLENSVKNAAYVVNVVVKRDAVYVS
ncbi:hypothetical protein CDQ84_19285 [Clostridium thermosuccinogenes]|uniref:Uncharacterized protein n=1 Tax=Clostridium thermosuccinogenes TaxID=84032 RepID=A0A2K2EW13_9CLOT|nr:hypothetical protein CDQ85_19265 [Pseudoclostridium thermosuccinogenes]PNT91756.1 hypothetical protein CDQ84_19285 [Pseudoclostridium thermosuccinogenes]